MKRTLVYPLLVMFICSQMVTGCSTIFGRQHDEQIVQFDSNVQDVEVICSGKRTRTPGNIPLKQSKSHSCTAKKDGYEGKTFRVRSGTSWSGFAHSTVTNTAAWGWWSLGIGTALGWLVDWPSGAMKNLKDQDIYLELRPNGSTSGVVKALKTTANVGKAVVTMPLETVDRTTDAVLDSVVHDTASKIGVQDDDGAEKA